MASSVASISSSNVPFGHVLRHQDDNNILKLKLKKPKLWNWELSTSKSSANIDFPRILLYDSNNKLLADVNKADFVINGKENEPHTSSSPIHLSLYDISKKVRLRKSCSFSVSNSTLNSPQNSSIIIRSDDKCSSLKTDSSLKTNRKCTRSHSITSQYTLHHNADDDESINNIEKDDIELLSSSKEQDEVEENLPEVPIYIYSAKGLVKRDFNAKEFDAIRNRQNSQDSGKSSNPMDDITSQNNLGTITKRKKTNTKSQSQSMQSSTIDLERNSISKCTSMAEILVNGKVSRKKSRRKIRRTKSMNSSLSLPSGLPSSSSSSKCQIKCNQRNLSTSSSDENDTKQMCRKPVYHIEKSAAGAIVVPEEKKTVHRRIRRRPQRSKSSDKLDKIALPNSKLRGEKSESVRMLKSFSTCDIVEEFSSRRHHHHHHSNQNKAITKTDTLISNVLLSHELDSNSMDKTNDECINDINEITTRASDDNENGETYKNYDGNNNNDDDNNGDDNEHLVSIKIENNQPNVKNGRASSANSYNNVNNGSNDAKQKKTQLNRKVSFVQFNCEKSNDIGNDCTTIHSPNDWIDVQRYNLNQNEKCINNNTRAANGRKKVFHSKIKKSASIANFYNNNYRSSDSDDGNDTFAISTQIRNKKRRKTQRPKSSSSSYQYHDDPAISHLQRSSDNVINNSTDKESLVKFEENLASFQNQWTFDKCERNRVKIIDNLFENGDDGDCNQKINESSLCNNKNASTTSLTVTPIINSDNNFYDNVTTTKNTNKNNHLNYRYQKVYQDGTDKTGYFTNTFFINTIKENEQCSNKNNNHTNTNELKEKLKYKQNQQRHVNNMGSNVSRNTAKGLSGRRAQSSGDLTNGNVNKLNEREHQIAIEAQANDPHLMNDEDQVDTTICPTPDISQLMNIKKTERNKFFGSLPNHLDIDSDETYREKIYNKSNTDSQKRPFEKNKLHIDSIQYPSSSPKVLTYNQTNHRPNVKSSTSNGVETTMHLKLAINRSNLDMGCDQGYGSERSPEDELPPILSIPYQTIDPHCQQKSQWNNGRVSEGDFNFITQDCCFTVQVMKNERGLGISVYGGTDTNVSFRGLIRIKRLFPNQAAWSTGMLQPGDILLEANDTPLTGLTNHEALEVLRTAPNLVMLKVCRPHDEQFRKLSPPADPPRPPQRSLHTTTTFEPQSPIQTFTDGEFEITMVKQQGSLGFTLRKEDESVLGHYVRALIRDPAASDGRIKPGDKIVAVNDVPLCPMTHEEAVIFLRRAKDRVKLRLYRDSSQTPIASISPSTSEQYISNAGKKASLRPEAMNLLIDLAHKNRKQSCDSYSTGSSVNGSSSSASPRRLRRNNNNNNNKVNSSDNTTELQSEYEKSAAKSFNYKNPTAYAVTMQSSSVCSDSETSTISQGSFIGKKTKHPATQCKERVMNDTFTVENQYKQQEPNHHHQQQQQQQQQQQHQRPRGEDSEYYNEEELWRLMDVDESIGTTDRPSHLDISGSSGYTPVVSRKPMFQLSAANGYELNNLDNEALDAPVYNTMCNNPNLNNQPYHQDGINNDFTSLPCETFLMSSRINSNPTNDEDEFSYKNPMYQSAHVQVKSKPIINDDENYHAENSEEDEADRTITANVQTPETTTTTSSEMDSSCATMIEINPIAADNAKDINSLDRIVFDDKTHEIITVELSRGWNSRLGFSLQSNPNSMQTQISAIYNDSVAAKDGRLKVGDKILMVNDESVERMTTAEIIDLLRIIRGSIVLIVARPHF
ncbi:putative uncharacterized protein DDB_G0282133 isoform X2 [Contarinia nasturtii]|uniref:putative uncharacterized protein DDB_G0282133 isoform X2 n=1 Tax=Contarinia nasturtii TaxID=265458 RepID=UPI0012D3DC03|nr:putative uncharacterized protein DDB_G0282133 isoform X2 [Contarinia nasturtii]